MAHDGVESVERALTLLDAFNSAERSLTLAELAAKTGVDKRILRLSRSLERFGYLSRRADGRYALGSAVRWLGSLYPRNVDLDVYARPVLRRLRDATGETASFDVIDGEVRVCL